MSLKARFIAEGYSTVASRFGFREQITQRQSDDADGRADDGPAVATCIGFSTQQGATRLVVTKAAEVPIMRPPTFVAKLPPVPRRCSGNAFGRYALEVAELRHRQEPTAKTPQ